MPTTAQGKQQADHAKQTHEQRSTAMKAARCRSGWRALTSPIHDGADGGDLPEDSQPDRCEDRLASKPETTS
jgi:hypothetical protein